MIEPIAVIAAAVGMFFNTNGSIELSYWIWIPSNALMTLHLIRKKSYWAAGLFVYYAAMCVWGLI